jgi:hypothetical protein
MSYAQRQLDASVIGYLIGSGRYDDAQRFMVEAGNRPKSSTRPFASPYSDERVEKGLNHLLEDIEAQTPIISIPDEDAAAMHDAENLPDAFE